MLWQSFEMRLCQGESKQQQMCPLYNGHNSAPFPKCPLEFGQHQAEQQTEGGQLRSDLQPYSGVGGSHMCLSVLKRWFVYVLVSVGVGVTVKSESSCRLRYRQEKKKKKLRWFVNSSVGVCLGVFLSFSSSSLSSPPLSVFVPTLPHTRACLYVIVCRDLLRITDRKPIHQGYLRRVTLFVWSEIETLPSAALSLSSSSLLPTSKPPPAPHPLSLSGVTT